MFAMRPARYHHEFGRPTEKPGTSAASAVVVAKVEACAQKSPDFATQVAQARRDALRHPAVAAVLLRSWMSDHE
jgi:hypothetical protein